ncbi:extensin [Iris pallida]|uniref:Extensin n=1 Tax=Iris pallida TaxID=29817 RepID=A0AAX6GMX3_IRIPA|nr:extensin [Iris pallida]KAJ6820260.1 extensin [Iris pallida]KAJ6829601.1 extensin [Iris pallida]
MWSAPIWVYREGQRQRARLVGRGLRWRWVIERRDLSWIGGAWLDNGHGGFVSGEKVAPRV